MYGNNRLEEMLLFYLGIGFSYFIFRYLKSEYREFKMRQEEERRQQKVRYEEQSRKYKEQLEAQAIEKEVLRRKEQKRKIATARQEHKETQSKRKEKRKRQMENNAKLLEELQNILDVYAGTQILVQPSETTLYSIACKRLEELKRKEQAKGNWTSVVNEKYSQVVQTIKATVEENA